MQVTKGISVIMMMKKPQKLGVSGFVDIKLILLSQANIIKNLSPQ